MTPLQQSTFESIVAKSEIIWVHCWKGWYCPKCYAFSQKNYCCVPTLYLFLSDVFNGMEEDGTNTIKSVTGNLVKFRKNNYIKIKVYLFDRSVELTKYKAVYLILFSVRHTHFKGCLLQKRHKRSTCGKKSIYNTDSHLYLPIDWLLGILPIFPQFVSRPYHLLRYFLAFSHH